MGPHHRCPGSPELPGLRKFDTADDLCGAAKLGLDETHLHHRRTAPAIIRLGLPDSRSCHHAIATIGHSTDFHLHPHNSSSATKRHCASRARHRVIQPDNDRQPRSHHSNFHPYSNGHAHFYSFQHAYSDPDANQHPDLHSDSYGHKDSHPLSHPKVNTHPYQDSYQHADSYFHSKQYPYSVSDAKQHTHSHHDSH